LYFQGEFSIIQIWLQMLKHTSKRLQILKHTSKIFPMLKHKSKRLLNKQITKNMFGLNTWYTIS